MSFSSLLVCAMLQMQVGPATSQAPGPLVATWNGGHDVPSLTRHLAERAAKQRADIEARFWSFVDRRGPDDCWPWTGRLNDRGYGRFDVGWGDENAHRFAYESRNGLLLAGRVTCHSCDVRYPVGDTGYRRCCNPGHLFSGTHAENMADMVAKRRSAQGSRHMSVTHPESLARGTRNGRYTHPERTARGSTNGRSKLTESQVRAMRHLHVALAAGSPTLAGLYGLSRATVSQVLNRQTWRHCQWDAPV